MMGTEDARNVEFYDEVNFGYLMHLVACFIRILQYCELSWLLTGIVFENSVFWLRHPVDW